MEQRPDLIVVGAGLAGLAAARTALAAGRSVVVVDPHPPGGRARSTTRDGFTLNLGPHALYLGGAAEQVLSRLGVAIPGAPPGPLRGRNLDVISNLPAGPRSLIGTRLLGTRSKFAVARLLNGAPRWRAGEHAHRSVREWLDGLGLPADAERLVEMLVRVSTYVNAPGELSAEVAIGQIQLALGRGVRYLDGGWQSLVDQLAAGLDIRRAAVTSIAEDGHGAAITLATGEGTDVLAGQAVVVAAGGPAVVGGLLGRRFEVGPPVEAACLDLGLRRPLPGGGLIGVDTPLYLSTHCPPARLAPPGLVLAHVARYLAPGDALGSQAQRTELLDHARAAGASDDDIVLDRYLHRMTVVEAMATATGGGLRERPRVTDSGQRHVFIAGDWVGPVGHLADASLASGEAAAQASIAGLGHINRVSPAAR